MLRNNAVLIPPEDLGSGSQFSIMKSLLSETVLQVEFSSLILGANSGIQIKLDIQYYIYMAPWEQDPQCPLQARSHKGSFTPAGAQCPCSHSELLVLGVDPALRRLLTTGGGVTATLDTLVGCILHSSSFSVSQCPE